MSEVIGLENINRGVYKRLLHYTRPFWPHLLVGIIATLSVSYIDATITWLVKPIINNLHRGSYVWYIRWMPLLFIALCLFRGAGSFCASYFVARAARTIVMRFRQMIFDHLLILPAAYFDTHSSGSMISTIIYNVDQVSSACSTVLQNILRDFSYTLFLLVVMFVLSPHLALLFLIIGPFIAFFLKRNGRRLRKLSMMLQSVMGNVTTIAEENIQGYKMVRLFGGQKQQSASFHDAVKINKQRELKMVVSNTINSIVVVLLVSIPIAIALYVATLINITAGAFIAFIVAMLNIQRPIRRLAGVNADIQRGVAGAHSIFNLLDEPAEIDDGSLVLQKTAGEISFKQVNFKYTSSPSMVLQDINLDIHSGETIALVGRSGSGKSTLVQLLPRFYNVKSGVISLDGHSLAEYSLADLRSKISMVLQDTFLFNGTIRDNLLFAVPGIEVDDEQLRSAAAAASILEFIEKQPQGFDTVVGDNGVLLSGGERQRIAIARAFLKDAPILILDEATSSLDSASEQVIQLAMNSLLKGRSAIVIAHRLSTIVHADRIYVMDKGRILENGTHSELLQKKSLYADLYNQQFKGC